MALTYPYPSSGVDTRMNYLVPITSPQQANIRVLPTWGGAGAGMGACSCQSAPRSTAPAQALAGLSSLVRAQASLGDLTVITPNAAALMGQVAPGYVWGISSVLRVALIAAGAYHGYARNGTAGSAVGYGLLATFLPTVGMITMAVQGIAEKK